MAKPTVIFGMKPVSSRVDAGENISDIVAQEKKAISERVGRLDGISVHPVNNPVSRHGGIVEQAYHVMVLADLENGRRLGLHEILGEIGYTQTPSLS